MRGGQPYKILHVPSAVGLLDGRETGGEDRKNLSGVQDARQKTQTTTQGSEMNVPKPVEGRKKDDCSGVGSLCSTLSMKIRQSMSLHSAAREYFIEVSQKHRNGQQQSSSTLLLL